MPAWPEVEKGIDSMETANNGSQSSPDRLYALYIDEAEKYDNALATRLKTSSDSLLIFAGLFSATVTALLIESYAGLTQNSADESVFYLAQIAQQLTANQLAAGNATSIQFTPFPTFETSAAAVRVNILWVLSLIVSLACALGATLIQTWMNRYTRLVSQYANVSDRARQREFFFEGLKRSRLVVVAEALPALLHLSLFLFLAGLVEFLLQANNVVAYVALGATVSVAAAYGVLTIMPFISASSPYQTPLSLRLPRRINRLLRRYAERAWHAYLPRRFFDGSGLADPDFTLRQSRALQWLLERMTDAYDFDKFVEGIVPFLGSMPDSTKIVYQLNVKTEVGERRRDLSAHIGFRLHACLDTSIPVTSRRTQVKVMTGALWNLFIRSDVMTGEIAPGGTGNLNERYPAPQHLQQWLHPYTLRSLRRLRHDEDPEISLFATCTCMVILGHVLQTFSAQTYEDVVPSSHHGGFLKVLKDYDTAHLDVRNITTSFEFDVMVICLLPPPELGQRSRVEEALDSLETSSAPRLDLSRREAIQNENHVLSPIRIRLRNTSRLAASQLFLEYLLNKTATLQPTTAIADLIRRTLKYVIVGTSAEGTGEDMQRSFVLLIERLFAGPDDVNSSLPTLFDGRATFLMEEIKGLVESVSKTLDSPLWSPQALSIIHHARIENLVIAESGRIGRVTFEGESVESGTSYFVSAEDRRDFLTTSPPSASGSVQVSGLRDGGVGQKWQLQQEGKSWALKNVDSGTFLGVASDGPAQEGARIHTVSHVTAVWNLRSVEGKPSRYCIYYGDSQYALAQDRGSGTKSESVTILSEANKMQWEFGRIMFNSIIEEDVNYYLALAERDTVVLDLSGWDNTTLLAYPINGGPNQKWKFHRDGEYWIIRCVHRDLFLDVLGKPGEGVRLIASSQGRCRWDIRPDKAGPKHYNLFSAGTEFAAVVDADIGHGETISLSRSLVNRIGWKLLE